MNKKSNRWYVEYINEDLSYSSRLNSVIYTGQSKFQHIDIIETIPFGKTLILDGKTQSSESDEHIYHELLVHPALHSLDKVQNIFIAGGGEGATAREALSHNGVESVTMVDLDEEVVRVCKQYLPNHHKGSFDDKRMTLIYDDALNYLSTTNEIYDLVIIDISDPLEAGPAYKLFTQEFYTIVFNHLENNGMMVLQAGSCGPLDHKDVFTAIYKTVDSIYPITRGYNGFIPSYNSDWGFIIGSKTIDPALLLQEKVDNKIQKYLADDLKYYDGKLHEGLFNLSKEVRTSIKNEDRIITLDNPIFIV